MKAHKTKSIFIFFKKQLLLKVSIFLIFTSENVAKCILFR